MIWQIKFNDFATKKLNKLDRPIQIRILKFLVNRVLPSGNPRLFGKALSGKLSDYWSYRIGDYRVVADLQDNRLIILVVDLDHRRQIYDE
jgi:mRNA interferase RelE/StbE